MQQTSMRSFGERPAKHNEEDVKLYVLYMGKVEQKACRFREDRLSVHVCAVKYTFRRERGGGRRNGVERYTGTTNMIGNMNLRRVRRTLDEHLQ